MTPRTHKCGRKFFQPRFRSFRGALAARGVPKPPVRADGSESKLRHRLARAARWLACGVACTGGEDRKLLTPETSGDSPTPLVSHRLVRVGCGPSFNHKSVFHQLNWTIISSSFCPQLFSLVDYVKADD